MLPSDGKALEDMAFDLISNANALAGQIHPIVTESVGNLVRSMNCYYSNLIEGHDTQPFWKQRSFGPSVHRGVVQAIW